PLTTYNTSKSVVDETAHLFFARDLTVAAAIPGATESLRVSTIPFADALDMVISGRIVDSMTIIAVLWAERIRQGSQLA
ncbi:MAG: NUDIX hydrolase, partial [Actinomycetota bacterium]|nr:NUDIX hydrolase [Actinomycetota bacterium]